ncbi:MAG TPA: hypothetical protein VH062_23805 [Polyangiaceae bacterium]|nr:hypothetical protein [Polyangiaceae bacterium]
MSTRILVQTTIPKTLDDWHVGRFSRLVQFLSALPGVAVTARDLEREPNGADRVLSNLDRSSFDQLWLFAVDVGDGLSARDSAGIEAFRRRGGGVLAARDHQDLGSSLLGLSDLGQAHYFHTKNPDPREDFRRIDDSETTSIVWPNYHSGRNGDAQAVVVERRDHPLMQFPDAPSGVLEWFPAHPHEGGVGAPHANAVVVATGRSALTGRPFNLMVAGETPAGRWIAESSFHHLADYNWDPSTGAPSFVTELPGDGLAREPSRLRHIEAYVRNAARWLSRASSRDT